MHPQGTFDNLLLPRGVAVIGASQNPTKLGYGLARNLVVSGYVGAIHFVNPKGGELFERPIHPRIADIPDPVDLAVILIPAAAVAGALDECGQRGIRAVIIGSGGFREVGPEGEALEQVCLAMARKHGIRVLGPNCIGYLDTHLPIDATFLPLPGPIPGDIAFLSHSGAICEAVIDWARGQGFGLSRLISLGNQMDLTEADLLVPTAQDPHTRVIAMYLEGVRDGHHFMEQARLVADEVPVVAIKVGRSESGREAVASHTGALAGRDAAYQAAFRKAGILRARTSEDMFDWARALAWCPLPKGRRIGVLTNAGGPGALAVDAIEANGLAVAGLSPEAERSLGELLPSAASVRNPVDMLASAGPREYARCLKVLLTDPGVDAVMVILPPPPMTTAAEVAGAIIPLVRSSTKPVVVALMGEELIRHAAQLFRQARVPDYRFPERAASALRVLVQRAERIAEPPSPTLTVDGVQPEAARQVLGRARRGKNGFIEATLAADVLAAYGVAGAATRLATSKEEAVATGEALGYPVALKIASRELPHKSEFGGVALNLSGPEATAQAYDQVIRSAKESKPGISIEGVIVQPMIAPGQEVIVGMVQDSQFGPLVMFGSGGVEVEEKRDVAFALSPLTRRELDRLLASTEAGRRLFGGRGIPASDVEAVCDVVLRLGQLGVDLPEIAEVEINPLRVFTEGKGALALDVRLRLN